ncbi:MAG: gp53-like domain-containing protein, partial [bacterium]
HDMVEIYVDNILGEDNDNIERGRDSNNPYKSLKRAIEEIPQGGWGSIYIKDNGSGNEYFINNNINIMRKYINFYLYDDEAGDKIRIKRNGNYRINISQSFLHFGDDIEIDENGQSSTFFFSRNSTIEITNSFKPILTSSNLIDGYSFYFIETDSGSVDISELNGFLLVGFDTNGYFKYRLKSGTDIIPDTHFDTDYKVVVKSELDAVSGDFDNYYTKTESDNRYLDESENLNDLPNKSTARTNLDVDSSSEVDNKITNGITGKADKVSGGTEDNIVTLDGSGNIKDSGKDFDSIIGGGFDAIVSSQSELETALNDSSVSVIGIFNGFTVISPFQVSTSLDRNIFLIGIDSDAHINFKWWYADRTQTLKETLFNGIWSLYTNNLKFTFSLNFTSYIDGFYKTETIDYLYRATNTIFEVSAYHNTGGDEMSCNLRLDGNTYTNCIFIQDEATYGVSSRKAYIYFDGGYKLINPTFIPNGNYNYDNDYIDFSTNGYRKFEDGLIMQWGHASAQGTISFPISFPNSCLQVVATQNTSEAWSENVYVNTFTTSNFNYQCPNGVTITASWIAIGY